MLTSMPRYSLLAGLALALLTAGGHAQASPTPCQARDLEIYDEGGDAGLGHSEAVYGLRNLSTASCTLSGVPILRFFDRRDRPLAIPYGRNTGDYMFQPPARRPVTLQPRGFAYFRIGFTTGDQQHHFHRLDVALPTGERLFQAPGEYDTGLMGLDVTAIAAGMPTDYPYAPPTVPLAALDPMPPGMVLTLAAPHHPTGQEGEFVHFRLTNTGSTPLQLRNAPCILAWTTASARMKPIHGTENCDAWLGELTAGGALSPGDSATLDQSPNVNSAEPQQAPCNASPLHVRTSLTLAGHTVRFAPYSPRIPELHCSDSQPATPEDAAEASNIKWSFFSNHGIRLGSTIGANERAVLSTQPIPLDLFIDNLTDQPLHLAAGPAPFRIGAQTSGIGVPIVTLPEKPLRRSFSEQTIAPHTWHRVESVDLRDLFDLEPGAYELQMGLRTLTGDAAAQNAPATGWMPAAKGPWLVGGVRIQP